jgi:copper chaperone
MKLQFLNSLALVATVVALAAGGPWLVHELRTLPQHTALAARAGQRIVTIEVGGMTCAGCAATIHGTLASVPGVTAVDVRLGQDRAYVVCSPGVDDTTLMAAVHQAGPGFIGAVVQR